MQLEAEGRLTLLAALQLYGTCPLRILDLRDNGEDPEQYVPPIMPAIQTAGLTPPPSAPPGAFARAEAALLSMDVPGAQQGHVAEGPASGLYSSQPSDPQSLFGRLSEGSGAGRGPHTLTPGGARLTALPKYEATLAQCLNIARKLNATRPGMRVLM